jgi:hypothetical protein
VTELEFSQDFDDFLGELNEVGVDYVVVGAHALAAHGLVRATGDLDVYVRPTSDNAERLMGALERFGAPVEAHGVSKGDFAVPGVVYQIGLPPNRIDVLTSISGVTFDECLVNAVVGVLGRQPVRFLGVEAQLRNKRSSGRTKDLADAEALEELLRLTAPSR